MINYNMGIDLKVSGREGESAQLTITTELHHRTLPVCLISATTHMQHVVLDNDLPLCKLNTDY